MGMGLLTAALDVALAGSERSYKSSSSSTGSADAPGSDRSYSSSSSGTASDLAPEVSCGFRRMTVGSRQRP